MQKTVGKRRDSTGRGQSMPVHDASGARSLVAPFGTCHARDEVESEFEFDSLSDDALEVELARVKATLVEREREIVKLKERVALLEGSSAAQTPVSSASELVSACPTLQHFAVAYASSSLPSPSLRDSAPPSQRRSPRRICEIELEFTEDTHFYAGLTQDISQGGVFIATYRLLPVGSNLELAFDLPDGTRIKTRGEVKWLRENASNGARPGMGVAFSNLPEDTLHAIDRFCRERPPLYMEILNAQAVGIG